MILVLAAEIKNYGSVALALKQKGDFSHRMH